MKYRAAIMIFLFSSGILFGYSDVQTEYYQSLNFLEYSAPPRPVAMVMRDSEGGRIATVKRGVLFTYHNRSARDVRIAGDFSSWRPAAMNRSRGGVWYYFLAEPSPERKEIRYKFLSDGRWIPDPENARRRDDGQGSWISVVEPFMSTGGGQVTYRVIEKNLVEFRIHKPDANFISITGDFNNWNPEIDTLLKGSDGIWRIQMKLPSGIHRYNFIVDGSWKTDIYNENTSVNAAGDLCSLIRIE